MGREKQRSSLTALAHHGLAYAYSLHRTSLKPPRKAPPERDQFQGLALGVPAGFVALPPIRQSTTWEVAPRSGMVSGGENHPGNEPGRSTCAGPGPLLPVSFAIRLTTAPQWEPRKPLGGTRKPRREAGDSSGAKVMCSLGFGPSWATHELQPSRSVTQADSVGGWRLPGAFTLPRVKMSHRATYLCGLPPWLGCLAFRPTPAKPGQSRTGRAPVMRGNFGQKTAPPSEGVETSGAELCGAHKLPDKGSEDQYMASP